jgi:hypothetical protein
MVEHLTIMQAWKELIGINYRIDLFETLRDVNGDVKASKVKEILVKGGFISNNAMLNTILKKDEYTDRLKGLYDSKKAYEDFIELEIERLKVSDIHLAVAFLKEYKKMKWKDIAKQLDYSIAQVRRYYDEYKGKTPKNNEFFLEK